MSIILTILIIAQIFYLMFKYNLLATTNLAYAALFFNVHV